LLPFPGAAGVRCNISKANSFLVINVQGYTVRAVVYKAWSTLHRRNLKTQLYLYGLAYRPHLSVTETELFENSLQAGGI